MKRKALLSFLIVLSIWTLLAPLLNPFILPSPLAVTHAFVELLTSGALLQDLGHSLWRVAVGFSFSLLLGTPLGLALALKPSFRAFVDPLLQFLRPIPPIAWIPLLILWLGLGEGPAYSLTMIASFFPIVLNTYLGANSVDPQHWRVARVYGASRWQMIRDIVWPSALPSIFTGYRIGLGIAWMAVMAAEMIAAHSGLGYLIQTSQNLIRTDQVLVGMITIGLTGLALDRTLQVIQKRVVRWS